MLPLDRAVVSSCRLSVVTMLLCYLQFGCNLQCKYLGEVPEVITMLEIMF